MVESNPEFAAELQENGGAIVYGPIDPATGTGPMREEVRPEIVAAMRAVVRDEMEKRST